MNFLIALLKSILIPLLSFILESGGRYVYEKVNKLIKDHDQAKRDAELKKAYDDAVKQDDLKKEAEAVRDIANGRKK